jgi:hypothetical protein
MKKAFVIFVLLPMLISCEIDKSDNYSTITNSSSHEVTVTDERREKIVIPVGESKSVERRGAATVKSNFTTAAKPNRVEFVEDSFTRGHFKDAVPYDLYIINLTSKRVVITTKDYIDGVDPFTVSDTENSTTRFKIFSISSAIFKAKTEEGGFDLSCSHDYDEDTKTVKLEIKPIK